MYSVAIVGATGAVGTEMLSVLERSSLDVGSLRLFASERSLGESRTFRGQKIAIEVLSPESFETIDFALFSAGSAITKQWRSSAKKGDCIIIDNSSAYRMDADVPLVIPEINASDLAHHDGLIAVPNCSTIIMLMAVAPLRAFGKINRIVVSTYQAVSGAGAKAMKELETQTEQVLNGQKAAPEVFSFPIAFNLFCHNTPVNEHGYNQEEWKMIGETKKILHDEAIRVSATCVRVPVLRAHSESINIEFESERPSVDAIRSLLQKSPGVTLVDDRKTNHFPMPLEAAGNYNVLVGHIREDISNPHAIELFAAGDQLLKGAALNAVQIAESMHKLGLLRQNQIAAVHE